MRCSVPPATATTAAADAGLVPAAAFAVSLAACKAASSAAAGVGTAGVSATGVPIVETFDTPASAIAAASPAASAVSPAGSTVSARHACPGCALDLPALEEADAPPASATAPIPPFEAACCPSGRWCGCESAARLASRSCMSSHWCVSSAGAAATPCRHALSWLSSPLQLGGDCAPMVGPCPKLMSAFCLSVSLLTSVSTSLPAMLHAAAWLPPFAASACPSSEACC